MVKFQVLHGPTVLFTKLLRAKQYRYTIHEVYKASSFHDKNTELLPEN